MKLTDSFQDEIIYNGKSIALDLSFDVVLNVFELSKDDLFSAAEKWDILAEMFAKNPEDIEGFSLYDKCSFAQTVLSDFIIQDQDEPETTPANNDDEQETKKQYYDLVKDAEYIYASFLFDYNIDLIEQQGKLHWKKFIALLNGLSEQTKFREVVGIRSQKITKDTPKEEATRLRKLKKIYALKKEPKTEEEIKKEVSALDKKLSSVAAALTKKGGR